MRKKCVTCVYVRVWVFILEGGCEDQLVSLKNEEEMLDDTCVYVCVFVLK